MSTIIITADSGGSDRPFASTVRAMRRSLDATEAQLATASGIGRQRLETIEAGGTTTRAESHHITVALDSLSSNRATQALPVAAQEMAAFTSSTTFFSTTGLHFRSAYDTGHRSPSSRFAASWKPRVAYR